MRGYELFPLSPERPASVSTHCHRLTRRGAPFGCYGAVCGILNWSWLSFGYSWFGASITHSVSVFGSDYSVCALSFGRSEPASCFTPSPVCSYVSSSPLASTVSGHSVLRLLSLLRFQCLLSPCLQSVLVLYVSVLVYGVLDRVTYVRG